MRKIIDGKDALWFVEIRGTQGEVLFRAEKKHISVYKDVDTNAFFVYLEEVDGRKLQGIYAGCVTVSIIPAN